MQHQPFNRKKQLGISVNSVDPKMIKIDILLGYTWIYLEYQDYPKRYIQVYSQRDATWIYLDDLGCASQQSPTSKNVFLHPKNKYGVLVKSKSLVSCLGQPRGGSK